MTAKATAPRFSLSSLVLLSAAAAAEPALRSHRGLVSFLSAPAALKPAKSDSPLPTRIKLLNWGENQTVQGPVTVGEQTLATLSANQGKAGFDTVCLDFNHNSVPTSPTFKGEPCHVAARKCKPEVVRGQGLFLSVGEYTPQGIEFAPSYEDVSATVLLNDAGEVVFLHSAALARQGAAEGMHFFACNPLENLRSAVSGDGAAAAGKSGAAASAGKKVLMTLAVDLDKLRRLFQLSADATEADVVAAIDAALAPEGAMGVGNVTALSARLDNIERDQLVAERRARGCIVPQEWLPGADGKGGVSLADLRRLCAALPENVVPLERRTPEFIRGEGAAAGGAKNLRALSADEQTVCRTLGLTVEQFLTAGTN